MKLESGNSRMDCFTVLRLLVRDYHCVICSTSTLAVVIIAVRRRLNRDPVDDARKLRHRRLLCRSARTALRRTVPPECPVMALACHRAGRGACCNAPEKNWDGTPLPLEIDKGVAEMTSRFLDERIGDWRRGPSAKAGGDFSPMNLLPGEPEEPPSCHTATTTLLTKPHRRINSSLARHGATALAR